MLQDWKKRWLVLLIVDLIGNMLIWGLIIFITLSSKKLTLHWFFIFTSILHSGLLLYITYCYIDCCITSRKYP